MVQPGYFADIITSYLPEPHASLLNGILLGIPIQHQWWLYQKLIQVGLIHLVVLSGMNITLLISLTSSCLFFLHKRVIVYISIITIVIFILFVGIQPPIIRAGLMGVLSLLGLLTGRKILAWYSLLLAGIISLMIWPEWVSSLSFYLSYASTSGLILFAKPFSLSIPKRWPFQKLFSYCISELQTSLAAQLLTLPLIWFYFGRISYISPLTNLLVSWTIAPLMALGFLICISGMIYHEAGKLPAFCAYVLLSYIIGVVNTFS